MRLKPGDCVALVACSDGLKEQGREKIGELKKVLKGFGLEVLTSPCIYEEKGRTASPKARADVLTSYYLDERVRAVFDVSGGDLSAELLPYLPFEALAGHPKPLFGYSDLTALLNGIFEKTGQSVCLYQVKNLVRRESAWQQKAFFETFLEGGSSLYEDSWEFWQGEEMRGIVAGGNIRCLLKLAGTGFFPKLDRRLLFLEARSGQWPLISSMLHQLKLMGAFERIAGLLLGTFTELEAKKEMELRELLERVGLPQSLPVAKTDRIGHGADSRGIWIGGELSLTRP